LRQAIPCFVAKEACHVERPKARIVALVVFFLVRGASRLMPKAKEAPPAPSIKDCPFCLSAVPLQATRCPHCTSQLAAGAEKRG